MSFKPKSELLTILIERGFVQNITNQEQLDYIHKIQNKYAIQYMLQPSSSLLNAYLFFILPPFLLIFLFMIIQWIVRGFKK